MKKVLLLVAFTFTAVSFSQSPDCNCCTEFHAAFDFWIGSWTVTNPDGTLAGTNTIEKVQDGCMLRENWKSAKGNFTGTSTNFYNYKTKQWEQLWVDNQGQSLHLKGNLIGNQMILETASEKNKDDQPYYHRVTWTKNKDGSVRQLWETITNDDDVSIAFDGLYKKTN